MPEPALTPFERLALAFQVFFWILFHADVTEGALRLREAHRRALSGAPREGEPASPRAGHATVETRPEPVAGASPGRPAAAGAGAPAAATGARPAPTPDATWTAATVPAPSPKAEPKPDLKAEPKPAARPEEPKVDPKRSALQLLAALQREGRLVDFVEEDLAGFSDASIGAAARTVHAGCKRVLAEIFELEPVYHEGEGATVTVAAGFDASAIRLVGNVVGKPPFKGALRHHGWRARKVSLPPAPDGADPAILAPAEVEL